MIDAPIAESRNSEKTSVGRTFNPDEIVADLVLGRQTNDEIFIPIDDKIIIRRF